MACWLVHLALFLIVYLSVCLVSKVGGICCSRKLAELSRMQSKMYHVYNTILWHVLTKDVSCVCYMVWWRL